ncbi:DUF6777 domain-containing protein [Streptomyces sp. IBSNAI002]|uniref:DUF6777 domain-containing protein n=1 Tax=Streptomyces sp. IBSNAI002 TaxID=3457500 RepID=UPI003FD09440
MHAPTPPTPRQAPRRHAPAGAALLAALGLFAAGCGGSEGERGSAGAESQDVYLQPVASAGPAPFTASSATAESAPVQPPLPNPTGQGIRTVNAATPGLYGGTQRLGSCDVEQQVRYLTEDAAKARAFAEASGIEQAKIPDFLRGLTPVVLRADTRVTSHGFRDGVADSFQSVLQAGSAVLVDDHGMPRVRCACGNPLLAPRAPKGSPVPKGDPWNGYQPNQVVVIEPTTHVIDNLVIVNIADNTWIERKQGDDGARDRPPQAPPRFDPADGIPDGPVTPPGTVPAEPCPSPTGNSLARTAPPTPRGNRQGVPAPPAPSPPPAADCPPGTPSSPSAPGDGPGRRPGLPTNPAAPQRPPSDGPSDTLPEDPFDLPSDAPSDGAEDQGDPFDPFGPSDPAYPSDPSDPYAVPEEQQASPSDPGYSLESA